MGNVSLSAGPPFPHQPGDASTPAQDLAGRAATIRALADDVTGTHAAVLPTVDGLLTAPFSTALRPTQRLAQTLSDSTLFAAGALQMYESARSTYNATIDGLNREWSEFAAHAYVPGGATPEQATAAQDASDAKHSDLRGRQRTAESALDGAASEVAGLLRRGPEAMADPTVRAEILAAVRTLASQGGDGDDVRILTLNAGGGKDNAWRNENGLDPGDIDQLAERILDQGTDVANLQEMFSDDLDDLEDELEDQSGEDWNLTFAPASQKIHWGSGVFDRGVHEFGNVVAVRAGDDGEEGSTGLSVVDTETEELAPANYSPLWSGSDGRSMAAVTVETESGERLTVSTAHTDYDGVSDEEQAGQIDELRTHTEEFAAETGSDYVVVTGDLNHTIDENSEAGESLREFEDQGYENSGAGVPAEYDEEVDGSTSDFGHGNAIDYVFTSEGLDYDDVDRVQGDQPEIDGEDNNLSDHDGIAVTVQVPSSDSDNGDDSDEGADDVGDGGGGGGGGSW